MSCRQQPAAQRGFDLLPQFNMPSEVVDFSLESRPPSLPPRNCMVRTLSACTISFFCIVGVYSIATRATGPVLIQGASIAREVKNRVGTAISQANKQEGERIHNHGNQFSQSRRLALEATPTVATYAAPAGAGVATYAAPTGGVAVTVSTDTPPLAAVTAQNKPGPNSFPPKTKNRIGSSLLLRMAALTKHERSMGSIDVAAVKRYFPEWEYATAAHWNDMPTLRDLVLAVSQLSQYAYVESEQLDRDTAPR